VTGPSLVLPRAQGVGRANVRVLRSPEEVEGAREAWSRMGVRHLDADIDYFRAVTASREEVIRPHVLMLERDRQPQGILVARLEERVVPAKFGYATLLRPTLRCITVVHGGAVGPSSAVAAMTASLLASLDEREADAVFLHRVAVDSPLYSEVVSQAGPARRDRFAAATRHWAADVPDTFEAFQKGLPKSLRGNVRRDGRKLLEALGDRIEIRRFSEGADVERMIADLEHVASKTYQRGLGAGFSGERERPLVRCAAEHGWFAAWILYIDGIPCAYEVGHVYAGTYFSAAKGFDPAHGRHNIGTFLQMRMFEDLCGDPDVGTFDFGFGDADYKRRCATRGWDETDLMVYSRAPRPMAVGAILGGVAAADGAARRLAGKERIARVKRRWRDLRTPG
jgi:CelD/BcsL family acetyltransferase involved in cellulose biosynthesis